MSGRFRSQMASSRSSKFFRSRWIQGAGSDLSGTRVATVESCPGPGPDVGRNRSNILRSKREGARAVSELEDTIQRLAREVSGVARRPNDPLTQDAPQELRREVHLLPSRTESLESLYHRGDYADCHLVERSCCLFLAEDSRLGLAQTLSRMLRYQYGCRSCRAWLLPL